MEKEKRKKLYKKIAAGVLCFLAFYIFLSGYVPPLVRKSAEAGGNAAEAGASNGERIACIDDNQSALLYRLRLIESAQSEIRLSAYSFYDDESGNDVICALFAAAERGVNVKIIVDGFNEGKLKNVAAFKALAAHENAEAKAYNPVGFFDFWRANFRLHDKYLTCDDSAYLLGGRNVGDLFLGDYAKKQNIDRDVLVLSSVRYEEGETASVNDVKAYFNAVWEFPQNRAFSGKIAAKKKERAEREMAARYAALKEKYPEISSPIDRESETLPARGVKLLHGDVHAAPKAPVLWKTIASALKGRDAVIQTPYAIMDNAMYEDLASIASSGGALRIVTNSVSSGANPWGCADYLNEKRKILQTGASVTEINGEKSSHVKTALAGENLCFIGSFNLDMRSAYLNTETALLIDCPQLNAALRAEITRYEERGVTFSLNESGKTAAAYGEKYEGRNTPFFKRIVYGVLRFVILPFRHLL